MKMKLSNETYDRLKWVTLILLPAVEVLWLTVGKIWGFPYLVEIGSTIAAIDVFLGSLLGISTKNYRIEKDQDNYNAEGIEMYDDVEEYEEEDYEEENSSTKE